MIQCGLQGERRGLCGVALIKEICHGVKKAPFPKGAVADNLLAVTEG